MNSTGDPRTSAGQRAALEVALAYALSAGARVGPYRLVRPLGKGGFAEVWEAESDQNGRRVALKVLTHLRAESPDARERFRQEGRLAASIASPRCVYVFESGTDENLPYIAMELVPGGTLAERLQSGPLTPAAAVDVVLEVVDGLESARNAGILHRDVKPSNVFLDASGHAKIGDFGISKSLATNSQLSQTGGFLGTPFYASPEQIAGEPLDSRSDLYSVGVMLYELVTGKLPYVGSDPSQVLAQVLTRAPIPFSEHDLHVPVVLQRVILRLLAKSSEKRFQSYEQLRAALVPLSSQGLGPPELARRFAAIVVDLLLFFPAGLLAGLGAVSYAPSGGQLLASLALVIVQLLYFVMTERYWGASVGKRLLRLRVTNVVGVSPSLGRVTCRAAVFMLFWRGPNIAALSLNAVGLGSLPQTVVAYVPTVLQLIVIGVLVSTMRRRNGYAGVHELASGTRVMALRTRERALQVPHVLPPVEPSLATAACGPFHIRGTLWRRPGEALLIAHDDELRRDVWVHEFASAAAAPPVERLRTRGEGSLPWLQRGSDENAETWDAYAAPSGTAFVQWGAAVEREGLSWREMRNVLASLALELESRFARDGTAGVVSARHVWVEPSGRALLLDFPITHPRDALDDGPVEVTPVNWRGFLHSVVMHGFERGTVPVPEYARGILAMTAENGRDGSIAEFRSALFRVAARPADVSRARRAAPFAALALVPAFALLLQAALSLVGPKMPGLFRDVTSSGYLIALRRADSSADLSGDATARRTADAIRLVLARDVYDARGFTPKSSSPLQAFPAELRSVLDSASRRFPAPDSQQAADARAWLARQTPARPRRGWSAVPRILLQSFTTFGYFGLLGVVLALLLRGGAFFGALGISVVRRDGAPAGRLRCGARALVAWSPLLLLAALSSENVAAPSWLRWVLVGLALCGPASAVWQPMRGLAERATDVVLVPK